MNSTAPSWAGEYFGDDAEDIRAAVWRALEDTESAMLDVMAAARSKKGFAAGSTRMTNQYERLVEHIVALGIEGTEVVKTGTWYDLPLVHDTLLYPVRAEVDGTEPDNQWPARQLSGLMQELFAVTDSKAERWVADTLAGLDVPELVVRRSLAELVVRRPRPRLVLIVYEMDRTGLKRAWWGQADLQDTTGSLRWVTERSLLATSSDAALSAVADGQPDEDRFDSGKPPEVPMAGRSESDRKLDVPPQTERDETTEQDASEGNED